MYRRLFAMALATSTAVGCATVQELTTLRSVEFRLDRISEVRLAGVDFSYVRSLLDLDVRDGARVASALVNGELPLSFQLHLLAENPRRNGVAARLVRLQWTLFLDDTATISGQIAPSYRLLPGEPTTVPIEISLDLLDYYERSGQELMELAMSLTGVGGMPKRVAVRAVPTINTTLGAITYPEPITIVSGSVGRPLVARN